MQQLETRSDEELEREQKFKAAAQAILGARAAERYDAKASREHFRRALAAARPQERMQLRRMADASLALAERRPDDLKAAVERLGQAPPSNRQLLLLRFMGLVAPPAERRARWHACAASRSSSGCSSALIVAGHADRQARRLAVRRREPLVAVWVGILLIIVVLGVLAVLGRRRQAKRQGGEGRPVPGSLAMCGRYSLATPASNDLRARFALGESLEIRQRFNVAPGDDVVTVTTSKEGEPRGELLRWGLVPVLGQGAEGRLQDDQRAGRDGGREARLPRRARRRAAA